MNEPDVEVVERVEAAQGELVLRRRGDVFELISNGVFLMDTSSGASERLLADAAVADAVCSDVLVAGLGAGFTLQQVLSHAHVERVTVVEVEEAVVRWNRSVLASTNGNALHDPRVDVVVADFLDWIGEDSTRASDPRFDAICLDIDNGPDWTVTEHNRGLYSADALRRLRERLSIGGRMAVWSASASDAFTATLGQIFDEVMVLESPSRRGAPDVVWVARRLR